jgi:hypothetical protein
MVLLLSRERLWKASCVPSTKQTRQLVQLAGAGGTPTVVSLANF